jgi:predicted ABC-class ATPase
VVVASVLMVVHQGVMAVYAVRTADANLRVVADFRAGKRTPAMVPTIYPDLAAAQPLSDRMRREGLYQRELRPDPGAQRIG